MFTDLPDRRIAHRLPGFLIALLMPLSAALADSQALIIGGGYTLMRSEGQIELNVKRIASVLETLGTDTRIWYSDGHETGPDVFYLDPSDTTQSPLLPLVNTFGDPQLDRYRFREHSIGKVEGSIRKSELVAGIGEAIASTTATSLWIIYNGHGSQSPEDIAGVKMNLWGGDSLTAREFHELLAPRRQLTRFIFTQCYSGGFHRLAFADPEQGIEPLDTPRCGFTAESAYRLAEGCSSSLDIGDYRDYTSFFYSALAGEFADGKPVKAVRQLDQNPSVSPREAHLFTLEHAFSNDLSRSTSEDYLEAWEPWYLKWSVTTAALPENEYQTVFAALSRRMGLDKYGKLPTARAIQAHKSTLRNQLDAILLATETTAHDIERLRNDLQQRAAEHWPALISPYGSRYAELAAEEGALAQIATWISNQAPYADLTEQLKKAQEGIVSVLELEREITQMEKLLRLRKLARLKQNLFRHGSDVDIARYQALIDCESAPF